MDGTIKLRSTAEFHLQDTIGLIYHEIGTHILRTENYQKQEWYKKKKEFNILTHYMRTEEGLAILHSLLPRNNKSAYSSAIRYIAIEYAQTHSFAELWKFLGQYVQDNETRWMIAVRQKRGMEDTSQPGGPTKDLVYFEGFVEVWSWLRDHEFDLTRLYIGKIAQEDVDTAWGYNPDFEPLLPSFFQLDRKNYADTLRRIGAENFLV